MKSIASTNPLFFPRPNTMTPYTASLLDDSGARLRNPMNPKGGKPNSIESRLEGKLVLPVGTEALASRYRAAKPFRHLVLDDMFPPELLEMLLLEIPELSEENWVHHDEDRLVKFNLRSALELSETGLQLTAFLHSALFLYFLSELTGIWNLLPDPYLQGAGYHVIPPGGHFDIHADRNTDYTNGLTRRLALIIYLNKSWKTEFGGQLELWNSDATRREAIVEPLFNRTVIFEVLDQNFHGVPTPVAPAAGRGRKSFVAYYHTARSGNQEAPPHTSIYAPMLYRRKESKVRRLIKDIVPPIVLRRLKKLRPDNSTTSKELSE